MANREVGQRGQQQYFLVLVISACAFVLQGCTDPGETTEVGATTGGLLGAGLGALIGSTSGDAGAGLAIGTVAGAGTGAAVGNAFQAQQEAIQTQDEAIERQQQMIRAQSAEIAELRRMTEDSIQYEPKRAEMGSSGYAPTHDRTRRAANSIVAGTMVRESTLAMNKESESNSTTASTTIVARIPQPEDAAPARDAGSRVEKSVDNRAGYRWQAENPDRIDLPATKTERLPNENKKLASSNVFQEGDCRQAQAEVVKADEAGEVADRLFHTRRALRLCPDNPAFHNDLARIYLALGRREDARFEFEEALRLDPGYEDAKVSLQLLKKQNVY